MELKPHSTLISSQEEYALNIDIYRKRDILFSYITITIHQICYLQRMVFYSVQLYINANKIGVDHSDHIFSKKLGY